MSRRRTTDAHYVNGIVRFKCPDGHPLGRAVNRNGHRMLEKGLELEIGPSGDLFKVKARCVKCEAAGKYRDLQASWEKVCRRIDELAQDPRAVAVDYILGG